MQMEKFNYGFVDKISPNLSERIDAFITISLVLDYDDIELYISTSNIIENLIKTLGIKKGFFSSDDLINKTYFDLISNLSFVSYLEALSIDIPFIHKIRKIRNTQHDFTIKNQFVTKETLLKEILDISVIVYNALFSNKVSFISQGEVKELLINSQVIKNEKNINNSVEINNDVLKKILSKAIDLLFNSKDIEDLLKYDAINDSNKAEKNIDDTNENVNRKKIEKASAKAPNHSQKKERKTIFKKLISEKKPITKNEYKKEVQKRKSVLNNMLNNSGPETVNSKYQVVLNRGYVLSGDLTEIRIDLKSKFFVLMKVVKEKGMVTKGFPGSAYDTILRNKKYVNDNVLVDKEIIAPICYDITIVCNMDYVKQDKSNDPFFIYKLAVDLINRIDNETIKLVGEKRAKGLQTNALGTARKRQKKAIRKIEKAKTKKKKKKKAKSIK